MDQQFVSHAAKEFRRRAAEARRMAHAATNLAEKQDLLAVEQWWLSQVRKAEAESEDHLNAGLTCPDSSDHG
jgi:hypothetical protein